MGDNLFAASIDFANNMGVDATPTIFINGQEYVGGPDDPLSAVCQAYTGTLRLLLSPSLVNCQRLTVLQGTPPPGCNQAKKGPVRSRRALCNLWTVFWWNTNWSSLLYCFFVDWSSFCAKKGQKRFARFLYVHPVIQYSQSSGVLQLWSSVWSKHTHGKLFHPVSGCQHKDAFVLPLNGFAGDFQAVKIFSLKDSRCPTKTVACSHKTRWFLGFWLLRRSFNGMQQKSSPSRHFCSILHCELHEELIWFVAKQWDV